ncbi:hypothetical protein HBE96_17345 [Clostridium sp. P21]|uniref:C2H2-type domain-containing protein n=1 Tax=Clostridium muellerianum TaxID=2716538 RepID=A0A7Y0EJ27_9CLOT|nr:hypothetical protein [Clostridium muellerianum]NMM64388.1 hypothetical protein [Clostridium muellerianum]
MDSKQIKDILQALKDKHDKQEQVYNDTVAEIQELCEHKELIGIMIGKKCTVCGKIFTNDDERLTHYKAID